LALNQRPVWPGLEGGRFKPLSDEDVLRIHHAALDVLEQIGLADAIPSCIEVCTAAGAIMNDKGRLLFPRAVVEDTLAKAARRFPCMARIRSTIWSPGASGSISAPPGRRSTSSIPSAGPIGNRR
jgi:Trimethylamine:corrinoid methyltransferase